jgi:hypothetical protein
LDAGSRMASAGHSVGAGDTRACARAKDERARAVRRNGRPWSKSEQQRPLAAASKAARIDPPINFHGLRHTYASRLAMRRVPLAVIAAQLGHSDTRMVEKHYGHLAPNYIADTVRAAFGTLGIVERSNVEPLSILSSRRQSPDGTAG